MSDSVRPILRFAPTPNGRLHLGHAYSALMNAALAERLGGRLLLRIEDLDAARCKPEYERAIVEDLAWLGVRFAESPKRQSARVPLYEAALEGLRQGGFAYACRCSRADLARHSGDARDPSGAPRHAPRACVADDRGDGPVAWRLDMRAALSAFGGGAEWSEYGEGEFPHRERADPGAWGDVVLKGKFLAASYHLAVVADDAEQGVTDIVRGRDLFSATSLHRLLQRALGLPEPRYRHHRLLLDPKGDKLAKSGGSSPFARLRASDADAAAVRRMLGFGGPATVSFSSSAP